MKKIFLFFVLIQISVVLCSMEEIRVKVIKGSFSVCYNGEEEYSYYSVEKPLEEGDFVKSGKDSIIELVYQDMAMFRMISETEVQIRSNSLKLKVGGFWVKLLKRGKDFITVTPNAVAGIRGTEFAVTANSDEGDNYVVINGLICVKSEINKIELKNEQMVNVSNQGYISAVKKADLELIAYWEGISEEQRKVNIPIPEAINIWKKEKTEDENLDNRQIGEDSEEKKEGVGEAKKDVSETKKDVQGKQESEVKKNSEGKKVSGDKKLPQKKDKEE